ncbi:hypothetical protein D3C84_1073970 [compost metagenome]
MGRRFDEYRGFMNFTPNDPSGDEHHGAEQEWNSPAPGSKLISWHELGKRQENGSGEELTGLYALERKTCEVTSTSIRSMLQDHRACAGHLSSDGKSLNQT